MIRGNLNLGGCRYGDAYASAIASAAGGTAARAAPNRCLAWTMNEKVAVSMTRRGSATARWLPCSSWPALAYRRGPRLVEYRT